MRNKKDESLGDDVYIGPDDDGYHTVIYTANTPNVIYLEPAVENQLYEYLKRIYGKSVS